MRYPALCVLPILLGLSAAAYGQSPVAPQRRVTLGWPEIFDPARLLRLNLEMDSGDWTTIQHDLSFDIEVPALLWMDGEAPILVSVRRKSCDALTSAPGFDKVSLKIDTNEYVDDQVWHDLEKLSLENGDDEDVVKEGLAWGLHRLAKSPVGYGYDAALANWATLVINGVHTGVYVNVEQRDDTLLKNRGLWVEDETWLYELDDPYGDVLEEGEGDSPAFTALCYDPFQRPSPGCPTPETGVLQADLERWIDMQSMLTLAAVDAFIAAPDALFSKGKNCSYADFATGGRLYFPWDLDSVLNDVNFDVFNPGQHYADIVLGVPAFRERYKGILTDMVDGPLHEDAARAYLDAMEALLTLPLSADVNNQIGDAGAIAEHFDRLRAWIVERKANVLAQVAAD